MDRTSGDRGVPAHATDDGVDLVSRSCPLVDVSFGALLDETDDECVQWSAPDGLEIVGCGVAKVLEANGPDRFDRIRSAAAREFSTLDHDGPVVARPRAFGGFAFHDGHDPASRWDRFAGASFVVPEAIVTRSESDTWLTAVGDTPGEAEALLEAWADRIDTLPAMRSSGCRPGVSNTRRTTTRAEWSNAVETALERIDRGELRKVVLAQALTAALDGPADVPSTLERLRRCYPDCYRFSIDPNQGGTFFGAPPERLVATRGSTLETEALAGSVPRGSTPETDDDLVERMCGDDKFDREHALVVEAIRERLAPLTDTLDVGERTVRKLATIQHLQTPIEGALTGDRHVLEVVEALHPTPAVGGLPTDRAWETIRAVESFDRGWYAAPVGWFDADGDGEFAVAIRSGIALCDKVTLFAGNGIVADSDPEEEWEEVQLKFRPILDELG